MKNFMPDKLRFYMPLLIASLIFYAGCLAAPGYCLTAKCADGTGLDILLSGWLGVITFNLTNLSWLGNPLLILSWVFISSRKSLPGLLTSFAALWVGSLALIFHQVIADEGGGLHNIIGFGVGYWLWLTSMMFAFFSAITQAIELPEGDRENTP